MIKKVRASVIITSNNEERSISSCLESLSRQTYKNFEVIIVDSSRDNTGKIIEDFMKVSPFKLILIKEKMPEGIAAARNKGIKRASGNILIFADADCSFKKNWVRRIIASLRKENIGLIGGNDKVPTKSSSYTKSAGYVTNSFLTTLGKRGGKLVLGAYHPSGFNHATKKNVLLVAGKYNPIFKGRGEEKELAIRIIKQGFKTKYVPDIEVIHEYAKNLKEFVKKTFYSGRARIQISRIHPDILDLFYYGPLILLIFLLSFMVFSVILAFFGSIIKSNLVINIYRLSAFIVVLYFLVILINATLYLKTEKNIKVVFYNIVNSVLLHMAYGLGIIYGLFKNND